MTNKLSAKQWGLVLLLVSYAVAPHHAVAASPNITKCDSFVASQLAFPGKPGWVSVIVKIDGPLTPRDRSQLAGLKADIYRNLPIIESVALRIPIRNLGALVSFDFVSHVSSDSTVIKNDIFTTDNSETTAAWKTYGVTGKGVTVAVVDSGINHVSDLAPSGLLTLGATRVVANADFTAAPTGSGSGLGGLLGGTLTGVLAPVLNVPASGDDACGHGTHVAGIIGGNGSCSSAVTCYRTFYGEAPNVNFVNVRVLDGNGQGSVSTVVSGLQWVVANQAKYKIRALNLSLGHPVGESYTNDPLCQACEAAWKAGIVVVCAAGNDGRLANAQSSGLNNGGYGTNYGSIQSPGNDPYVITVGAMKSMDTKRTDDQIATYSSRGPSRLDLVLKPDIVAPGNKVISLEAANSTLEDNYTSTNTVPVSSYCSLAGGEPSKQYFCLSGTSMATPVVTGAVALMLEKYPTLTPDTIKARLMISADKWTNPDGTGDACTFGAGYLDVAAAMASTIVATQSALSPTLSADASGNVYINTSTIWGSRAVWGSGVNDLRAVWGSCAVTTSGSVASSTDELSSSRAVWGSSVWESRAVWGSSSDAVDLSAIAIYGE